MARVYQNLGKVNRFFYALICSPKASWHFGTYLEYSEFFPMKALFSNVLGLLLGYEKYSTLEAFLKGINICMSDD